MSISIRAAPASRQRRMPSSELCGPLPAKRPPWQVKDSSCPPTIALVPDIAKKDNTVARLTVRRACYTKRPYERRTMIRIERMDMAPVKSLALTEVARAFLDKPGIAGDRAFFLIDDADKLVTQREYGPLVQIKASYDPD